MRREIDEDEQAIENGVIPCPTWDLDQQLYRTHPIPPDLPDLHDNQRGEETKLVKIASLLSLGLGLLGLTNKGHLLKFEPALQRFEPNDAELEGEWIYVSCLSCLFQ